ncbi:MAG: PaaI family thioesterase, partial [Anaerolineae bacterium]|nr:PaaI family thioesterase [Anaerolineae bacterium]
MEIVKDKAAWLERVKMLGEHTVMKPLGIEMVDINDDGIELRMPITDASRQPMGLLHGGVSMVLAETAASVHAAYGVDLEQVMPAGIEINGSHLRSASDGHVRAVGKVLRKSVHLVVHQVDIIHVESG